MTEHLKELFGRALDDEPAFADGDVAARAMAQGRGIRRRRRGMVAGGSVAAALVAAVVGLNLGSAPADPPPVAVPAALTLIAQAEPQCAWQAASDDATDVYIALWEEVSEEQRDTLRDALRADPLVRDLRFESQEQAYERFKNLWSDSPDFVASIDESTLPTSFRLKLGQPSRFSEFAAAYAGRPGVQSVIGGECP
ncbi:permease-like cell division protein FtsX [Actinoplanes sp. CA-131856]